MLVGANDSRIEHQAFQIRVFPNLQQPRPDPALAPSIEPLEHRVPLAKTLGKIAPRNPGPCDPKHGVDKEAIVGRGPAGIAVFTRQQILDSIPLFVRYLMSSHGSSLNRTATGFTKKPKNALDECQQNLVRRRCRYVIVSDASQESEHAFEDLGNLIRKIRIDLGIYIEIAPDFLRLQKDPHNCRWH